MYICVYMYINMYVYICITMCMYVCMYIYVYQYVYMYMYMYIRKVSIGHGLRATADDNRGQVTSTLIAHMLTCINFLACMHMCMYVCMQQ
jgi:hypothetical protein